MNQKHDLTKIFPINKKSLINKAILTNGADDGNRTHVVSLEG